MRPSRRALLAGLGSAGLAGLAGLAGCTTLGTGTGGDGGDGEDVETSATATETTDGSGPPVSESRVPLMYDLDRLEEETLSGGPPKDGIPSIDEPQFEPAGRVGDRLADGDVVFGLEHNGVAKAYPQSVLVWHEICNDTAGEEPISVTYCPLTGTVQGFLRGDTTFGVSGNLVNSNLIMYDRATDSRWPQMVATAKDGPLRGRSLREFELVWTTWGRWRETHPETVVLTEDTGYARNYGQDPYGSYNPRGDYYDDDDLLFPALATDDRYDHKAVVVGTRSAGVRAFHEPSLRESGLLTGEGALAAYDPTLDTAHVYRTRNPDAYAYDDGRVTGPDGEYAPDELPLERALSFDAMWFAWYGFYPETEVHE